jgi:hypothetical protein
MYQMATKPKTTTAAAEPAKASVPAVQETAKAPAVAAEYAAMGGTGFEDATADDYVLPFYTILQGLSPQIETVDGAKPGLIINTTSNALKGTSMDFVTARREHEYVEWLPNRGGFVAKHKPDSAVVKEALAKVKGDRFTKLILDNGNLLVETFYLYGVVVENMEPVGLGCLAFASTKIKKYKAWYTQAQEKLVSHKVPMAALCYRWSTAKEKNTKGEFYNWAFGLAGGDVEASKVKPGTALFKTVMDLLSAKDIKVDHSKEGGGSGDDEAGSDRTM